MKRVIYSLLIVLGIVLLSGCVKNIDFSKTPHIVCKKLEINSNEDTTTIMTFSYDKNEKLQDFRIESNTNYKQAIPKETLEIARNAMKLISRTIGLGFKSEVSENRLYFSFDGNIKSLEVLMKQLNKESRDKEIVGDTKQEALTELTKEGYTCEDYNE